MPDLVSALCDFIAYMHHFPKDEMRDDVRPLPRGLIFSPSPPPPMHHHIPPVPPLPTFSHHLHLPPIHTRARPRPRTTPHIPLNTAGVVRPREEPFGFEININNNGQHHFRFGPEHGVADAYRTVQEAMAMDDEAALRRAEQRQRTRMQLLEVRIERERARRRAAAVADGTGWIPGGGRPAEGGWMRYLNNFWGQHNALHGEDDNNDPDLLEALAISAAEAAGTELPPPRPRGRFLFGHYIPAGTFAGRGAGGNGLANAPDYRPEFTHLRKSLEKGFIHDFAVGSSEPICVDEPGPSSSSGTESCTLLVCAVCQDPLLANAVGSIEYEKQRKVWALRCGHLFDGKCIEKMMTPKTVTEEVVDPKGKGKGKAKVVEFDVPFNSGSDEASSTSNGLVSSSSNKRKASEMDPDNDDDASNMPMPGSFVGENPMHLRLRPRHNRAGADASSTTATETGTTSQPTSGPSRSGIGQSPRGKGKGKGKGRAPKPPPAPVVLEVFEWFCPVKNCGKRHHSVQMSDAKTVWKMDEEKGAVAVYV